MISIKIQSIPNKAPGWFCLSTKLEHLTVLTWAVEPARLRRHIPEIFSLERVSLDGEEFALISAVTFLNTAAHLKRLPTPGLRFGQTNYRVYVRQGGQRAVYFLGTTIDSWSVIVPNIVWKMPWTRGKYQFQVQRQGRTYSALKVEASGQWGMAFAIEDLGEGIEVLKGFEQTDEGLQVLTQPHIGFYPRGGGKLGRYTIWHDFYKPKLGKLIEARFDLLSEFDLVPFSEQNKPHSVIIEPTVSYEIHLPPMRWTP